MGDIKPKNPDLHGHSHPGHGEGSSSQQVPSDDDRGFAKDNGPGVLFTPDGPVTKYDSNPKNDTDYPVY